MSSNSDRELIQQALPGYEVGVELGRGAWGVVLSGRHRRLDRQVAIKQLPRAFAADPQVSERFLREARMAASLDHPHIVPVYDYVEQDGLALIVMERCVSTVGEKSRSDGIDTDEACAATLATCSALTYAHSRGVLHRDIKPENLLIDNEGVVKLGDFGIARALDAATKLTATGTIVGTPAYMSPEQAGGTELKASSDVYSLGVVLYELLSGDLPFEDVSSVGALLRQHLFEPPRPLNVLAPDVPARIASVVDQCLEKDPTTRWAGASEFGVALAEATSHALGAGWLRQRRFALLGAPEIIAATERTIADEGRAGAVLIGGNEPPDPDPQATVVAPTGDPVGDSGIQPPAQPRAPIRPSSPAPQPIQAQAPSSPTVDQAGVTQAAAPTLSDFKPPTAAMASPAPGSGGGPPGLHGGPDDRPGGGGGSPSRASMLLAGVAGVLLVAIAVLGFVVFRDTDDPVSTDASVPPETSVTTATTAVVSSSDGTAPAVVEVDPLIIGTLVDNGEFARDDDQLVAMDLAVADIAAAGGVLGQPLVFVPGTYEDDATMVAAAIDHLALGVTAVIGPSSAVDTADALSTVTGRGAVLISPTDFFSREDDTGLYFQTRIPTTLIAEAAVSILAPGTSSVVLITPADSFSVDEAVVATIQAALAGRDITLIQVDIVDDDVSAAAREVVAADADVVMLYGFIDLTELYTALISVGVGPQSLPYVAVADDGVALDLADGATTGVRGVSVDFLTGQTLEERLPATDLSSSASQAFDAVIVVALAAEQAGSASSAAIAAALPEVTAGGRQCMTFADCKALIADGIDIDYVGPGGPYALSPDTGRPTAGYFQLSTLGDTGFVDERERLVFASQG